MLKCIARFLFILHGWSFPEGPIPKETERCMFVFAPHTSNWDWYYGTLFIWANGLKMKVAIKKFWMRFPLNLVIRPLGGVAVDRKRSDGRAKQIEAMADIFKRYEKACFVITPEGTRGPQKRWKTGFYYIAQQAEVPIVTLSADFPNRTVKFGPIYNPNEQTLEEVMRSMMQFYKDCVPVVPENFMLDEKYI